MIKTSPSFDMLEEIADFVKLAEYCYMYNNNANGNDNIYSSRSYAPNENGFKINNPGCTIICKLVRHEFEDNTTYLEIRRHGGNKLVTQLTFTTDKKTGKATWSKLEDATEENSILLNDTIALIWRYVFRLCHKYIYE